MKKILWVLLALVLLLTACGTEETPETTEPPIEVEIPYEEPVVTLPYEGVELTFRSIWQEQEMQAQVLIQAAQHFEKKTGAVITVLWQDTGAEIADILQIRATDFEVMDPELAMDLTEMAQAACYAEKSHEVLREQIVTRLGYLGAVAQVPYLGGVYYNVDAFEESGITELPENWDDFVKVSQTLRKNGWQPLTLDKEDAITAMELHLRRTIGTENMIRFMGKDDHWHFDEAVVASMEQVMLYAQSGNMTYGTPADYPAGQNKMALSNSAMMVGTNGDCADIEAENLMDLRWGVFPYPGQIGSGTWMTADMLVVEKNCKNAQAAFDFVMLLSGGEFDQLRVDIAGGIPADPANKSSIAGAMEAIAAAKPEVPYIFGNRQMDAAVKLWTGWYDTAFRHAVQLERSK